MVRREDSEAELEELLIEFIIGPRYIAKDLSREFAVVFMEGAANLELVAKPRRATFVNADIILF